MEELYRYPEPTYDHLPQDAVHVALTVILVDERGFEPPASSLRTM